MNLGNFSVSLAVKDIAASRRFYEAFGFVQIHGEQSENWIILEHKSNGAKIGLFQGMFEANILTFNPTDVRAVQKELKAQGIEFQLEADETTQGPAYATLQDPDGNAILLDQHE
jgi:lactoylglutathione lyase